MNSPETNDPIEKILREQDHYVADEGFTKRVIARLPRQRTLWPRMLMFGVVATGALLATHWLSWKNLPPLDYSKVLSLDPQVLSAWLPFFVVVAALVSGLFAALRRQDD